MLSCFLCEGELWNVIIFSLPLSFTEEAFIKNSLSSCCSYTPYPFTSSYFFFNLPILCVFPSTLHLPTSTSGRASFLLGPVNLNFLGQIHFSCLGTLTKQFLSTDLAPCANVSTDQVLNEMLWLKQPHIETPNQTCTDNTHSFLFMQICKETFKRHLICCRNIKNGTKSKI